MIIYVGTITGETITLDVEPSDTIEIVCAKIQEKEGYLIDNYDGELGVPHLIYEGELLNPSRTLEDYNIGKESILYIAKKIRWG